MIPSGIRPWRPLGFLRVLRPGRSPRPFVSLLIALLPWGSLPSPPIAARAADVARVTPAVGASTLRLAEFGKAGLGGDDTSVFHRALAEGSRTGRAVQVPRSRAPYRVAPLYFPSHVTLLLDGGVEIDALPGYADGQKLFNIDDATAVEIIGYGATLRMDRSAYRSGAYRHCISITGSSLVAIKGLTCAGAGGNGVFIGPGERRPFSQDVSLEDLRVEDSVAAGLKIVSARNLAVRRSQFLASHNLELRSAKSTPKEKPAPQGREPGIEIFPNVPAARLENIRLEDNRTSRNAGDGILLVLSNLTEASTPVSVTILRHRDDSPGGSSYLGIDDPASGKPARGQVQWTDCRSENAQEYGAVLSFWSSAGVRASFQGLTVIDANGAGSTIDNVAVAVKRGGGGRTPIGNVEFLRTTIRDTRRRPKLDYYFSFVDYSRIGIQHVLFKDAVELSGARHKQPLGLYQGEGLAQIQRVDDPTVLALWQTAERRDSAVHAHSR